MRDNSAVIENLRYREFDDDPVINPKKGGLDTSLGKKSKVPVSRIDLDEQVIDSGDMFRMKLQAAFNENDISLQFSNNSIHSIPKKNATFGREPATAPKSRN